LAKKKIQKNSRLNSKKVATGNKKPGGFSVSAGLDMR
jgi:hypothetical protein